VVSVPSKRMVLDRISTSFTLPEKSVSRLGQGSHNIYGVSPKFHTTAGKQ
jgi:hypothetical protein